MGVILEIIASEEEDPGGIKNRLRDHIIHRHRRYSPNTPDKLRALEYDDGLGRAKIGNNYTEKVYPKQETFEVPICRE